MTAQLVVLTDLGRFPAPASTLEPLCRRARPGSVAVILRDRDQALRRRLDVGRELRQLTGESEQAFFVSDRVDLALELHADGVHLSADGLLPSEASALFPGALIGRAHHGAEGLEPGELALCSHLLVSPVFAERKGRRALGQAGLSDRCARLRALAPRVRLLALGGVDRANARAAIGAGADGAAAISAAHEPAEQLGLLAALDIQR